MKSNLFWQLTRKDLTQFKRVYRGKFFDTLFLFFTNIIVFGYFMPLLGLPGDYGAYIMIGAIASFGLFDIVGQVAELIFDIEGNRTITFTLSMPTTYRLVFLQLAFKWAAMTFLLCIPLFIFGKLLLWDQFDLTQVSYFQLLLIYPTTCFFFGIFSLWMTAIVTRLQSVASLFLRVINPVFMFGAYFFTWHDAFDLSHPLGYFLLINPMIYVMEGMRAAALGQEGYLPFWNCFIALWTFNGILWLHAIRRLKKRLDCV